MNVLKCWNIVYIRSEEKGKWAQVARASLIWRHFLFIRVHYVNQGQYKSCKGGTYSLLIIYYVSCSKSSKRSTYLKPLHMTSQIEYKAGDHTSSQLSPKSNVHPSHVHTQHMGSLTGRLDLISEENMSWRMSDEAVIINNVDFDNLIFFIKLIFKFPKIIRHKKSGFSTSIQVFWIKLHR